MESSAFIIIVVYLFLKQLIMLSFSLKVAWYSILGCVAGESNTKVRLNNNKLPNAGEEVRQS